MRNLALIIICQLLWISLTYAESEYAVDNESVFDVTDVDEADSSEADDLFTKLDTDAGQDVETPSVGTGYYNSATLIAINKITAQSKKITVKVGQSAYFYNAEIKLHKCWKDDGLAAPSNQAMVTVIENKFDEDPKQIFRGWLISSAPALSTLEQPVYEVMSAECVGSKVK